MGLSGFPEKLISRCLFVCLRLYVPVNNFSVILGRLPGSDQY